MALDTKQPAGFRRAILPPGEAVDRVRRAAAGRPSTLAEVATEGHRDREEWTASLRALAVAAGYDAEAVDFRLVAGLFIAGRTPEEAFAEITAD